MTNPLGRRVFGLLEPGESSELAIAGHVVPIVITRALAVPARDQIVTAVFVDVGEAEPGHRVRIDRADRVSRPHLGKVGGLLKPNQVRRRATRVSLLANAGLDDDVQPSVLVEIGKLEVEPGEHRRGLSRNLNRMVLELDRLAAEVLEEKDAALGLVSRRARRCRRPGRGRPAAS